MARGGAALATRISSRQGRAGATTATTRAEAILLSVDDLEGMEMTEEILGDSDSAARISENLAALGRGERGVALATVRQDLARRRAAGA